MTQCAVWYQRRGESYYELCHDEEAAARYAYALEAAEDGYVSGVQFADGDLVEREQWQALADYEQQQLQERRDRQSQGPVQPPATRQARDPFDGQSVSVDASDPDWLGA